jgi:hypothetical protein
MAQKAVKKYEERGRPSEKTPDIIRKIEEAAALGASYKEIAFYAEIHLSTLYRWMEDDPHLRERIEELHERPILKARQTIVKSLEDPNHARWYLEKKRKTEFGTAEQPIGTNININLISNTPEFRQAVANFEDNLKKLITTPKAEEVVDVELKDIQRE